ncbi:aminoglycoside phosphotransferase family protein [Georgenia sp. MJ206]|uniref:aminoglycoside phosphotransferase family protein n=1 Tax=Georgenia wangjunii TaxID=3117730 RepID=UPI002F263F05
MPSRRPPALTVPDALRDNVTALEGGPDWLAGLPDRVARARERWHLRLAEPFTAGTTAWTAPGTGARGADVVLKVLFPHQEARWEGAALVHWVDAGAVELLDHDAADWALLLRRLRPGHGLEDDHELAELAPTRRVAVGAELLARLHTAGVPAGTGIPALADEAQGLADLIETRAGEHAGGLEADRGLLAEAAALWRDLPGSAPGVTVVHGDLNPGNVLAHDDARGLRRWVAIDPKPLVGDAAYDPWPLLTQVGDPFREEDAVGALRGRTRLLASTVGLEPSRIAAWAAARTVEGALWRAATHGRPQRTRVRAELDQARAWARLMG